MSGAPNAKLPLTTVSIQKIRANGFVVAAPLRTGSFRNSEHGSE